MKYRYLDDVAISDIAFEAEGRTIEEVFVSAAEALAGAMVEDPASIGDGKSIEIRLEARDLEMLLFDFLSELVYIKDAEGLLLRVEDMSIEQRGNALFLRAEAAGVPVRELQDLRADVKAVTMHQFRLKKKENGAWCARVVLDI